MFKDLNLGIDMRDEWKKDTNGIVDGIDMSNIKVISQGAWPD